MKALTSRCGLAAALLLSAPIAAQQPPENGPRTVRSGWHALVGARAVVAPDQTLDDTTIVVRNGRIVSVTTGNNAPAGARVWDCSGLTVYAGMIEPYVAVEAPATDPSLPGVHWSTKVAAQRTALDGAGLPRDRANALRKAGFTVAGLAPGGGIFRGQGSAVLLTDDRRDPEPATLRAAVFHSMAFDRRSSGYPGSEMGVMAMMRQTLMDTDWHQRASAARRAAPDRHAPVPPRLALETLSRRDLPLWFEVDDELQALRAVRIAKEFRRNATIVASGLEFRRLEALAKAGFPMIVPVDFPLAPDVSTRTKAEGVSLRDLLTWEQAPTNPARVQRAGIPAAFTSHRLDTVGDFRAQVRMAIEHGLPADRALAMVTTEPARLLGLDQDLGRLTPGRLANFTIVADGELFDEDSKIHSVWVRGVPFETSEDEPESSGTWGMVLELAAKSEAELEVGKGRVKLTRGDTSTEGTKVVQRQRHLEFVVDGKIFGVEGRFTLAGHREGQFLFGNGTAPDGSLVKWVAKRKEDDKALNEDRADEVAKTDEQGPDSQDPTGDAPQEDLAALADKALPTPLGAYGLADLPEVQDVVLTGATVWTSGPAGIVESGSIWIRNGKVAFVGATKDLPDLPASVRAIDMSGRHITPGIIDCHSHTGISRGINESRQTITSEVRVGDVLDPDAIGWYRQLAGGVTAVNQLHGSANPIGGQNHVAKLRWGSKDPAAMSLQGAPGGIKFALGENPRRANGSGSDRYPSTRMGVAAIIRDRFEAARDYRQAMAAYNALDPRARALAIPPRQDLELDAIVEIIAGERLIHCHSYRQDEIFMLCRFADEFGFKIGTLQHVLEGYKVADTIKQSALGASAFSDWWAYKLEVFDAIPDNGAIMQEIGVVVSFNSDSNELARRLNTEAGKALRYGNVAPAEALKFVTLNPAIQLGIADRVGSLERGKDADLAIWTGDPLSYRSRCVSTWIDGREMFSDAQDLELRKVAARERQRLLQKALAAKKVQEPPSRRRGFFGNRYWFQERRYSCCDEAMNITREAGR